MILLVELAEISWSFALVALFVAKVGTNATIAVSTLSSFGDVRMFPLLRRNTANGICFFFARLGISAAPLIAELNSPVPVITVIVVTIIGLGVSFKFPAAS